eukprot:GEMP01027048.1.p1 GENE.GEMP01027048.1~~GEMP01027048.1.p1  ORF type:complete len:516 (+),score=96.49 GEMP01027048.1:663-2210(+)
MSRNSAEEVEGDASRFGILNHFTSLLETQHTARNQGVREWWSGSGDARSHKRMQKELQTAKYAARLRKVKKRENAATKNEGRECRAWTEEECLAKYSNVCSWHERLSACLIICSNLKVEGECRDHATCKWLSDKNKCVLNSKAHPRKGDASLHKHKGELDERTSDAGIPYLLHLEEDDVKDDDFLGQVADTMDQNLYLRVKKMKKDNPMFRKCGVDNWHYDVDVEVAAQMVGCRMWRIFFEWMFIQMEKKMGFSADWRNANSTFTYFTWFSKDAQTHHTSFYDRIWMLNADDVNSMSGRSPETFAFGDSERGAALYEEQVAKLTTRPLYFHLINVFTDIGGEDLDPVLPYYGTYGWYHLGRTRDTRAITEMIDGIIYSLGRNEPLFRDAQRDLVTVENLRAILAERKTIESFCPRLYLDPRQYSHYSFSPLKAVKLKWDRMVWNTREEPLSCSLTQVMMRIRGWNEAIHGVTLVDPEEVTTEGEDDERMSKMFRQRAGAVERMGALSAMLFAVII